MSSILNHPLTGPSGHLSPCLGRGIAVLAPALFQLGFLSPTEWGRGGE